MGIRYSMLQRGSSDLSGISGAVRDPPSMSGPNVLFSVGRLCALLFWKITMISHVCLFSYILQVV